MRLDTELGGAHALSRRTVIHNHDPEAWERARDEAVAQYGGRFVGRHSSMDMLTFDASRQYDAAGNHMGKPVTPGSRTHPVMDGRGNIVTDANGRSLQKTYTYDSTGAFLVGELERLDMTFHGPLVAVSWQRDIDLREDVTTADDASSFTLTTFGAAPGAGGPAGVGQGISWAGRSSTQVTGVSIDISKIVFPLIPWSMEIAFTVFELESAAKLGRPVDEQKFKALQTKHQMDVDQMVYYGDGQTQQSSGASGLLNNTLMSNTNNLPNGVSGFSQWVNKSPQEILADVNSALTSVWAASAWAVTPRRILIPPNPFGYISTALISLAGSMSILRYIVENNLLTGTGQGELEILPLKWLIGLGSGGTLGTTGTVDRMFVYTKNKDFVRYPMTLIQRTPVQYDGLYHKSTYYCKLGQLEEVYPETVGAFDGL